MGNPVDMSIELAGVRLQNPVMPASGTFGYGQEYKDVFDLNKLGALVTKSITKEPRYGNELPRIAECTSGMPIIGIGGISCADDVLEMIMAGATGIEIGSANLVDPWTCQKTIDALPKRMKELGIRNLEEIRGVV